MKYKELPSQEYLLECFDYDPETGILTWKERPLHHFKNQRDFKWWNNMFARKIINNINTDNYYRVCINSKFYFVHRIIWKLFTGKEPFNIIDHINNNTLDNRFYNLREASDSQSQHNKSKNSNNTSGYKGVSRHRSKWQAKIYLNNTQIHLGTFNTVEEAYQAYCQAAEKYHKEFKNLG